MRGRRTVRNFQNNLNYTGENTDFLDISKCHCMKDGKRLAIHNLFLLFSYLKTATNRVN